MGRTRLDQELLAKIAKKKRKSVKSVRERVSRLSSKLGISSQAALLRLARQAGIGIARPLARLDPAVQQQVGAALETPASESHSPKPSSSTGRGISQPDPVASAIECLLTDKELRSRCSGYLRKKKFLDSPVREAITVLENRLRARTGLGKAQEKTRAGLVAKALNPNPNEALIVVSQDPDEQKGAFFICSGLMGLFGNPAHHSLRNDVTQQEALAVCGAVNLTLMLIDKGTVQQGATAGSADSLAIQKHEDRKRGVSKA
ncbi:MAG: TIGR02391 family protein [Halobacteria archaeon]